jgi:hypothetical protein
MASMPSICAVDDGRIDGHVHAITAEYSSIVDYTNGAVAGCSP